ncbi:hypothetical protein FRC06_009167 [Ceratobasidium sp. 370]|nr:hypothetical protein FRC06_009167 [Ceratobasidium sp. 370]
MAGGNQYDESAEEIAEIDMLDEYQIAYSMSTLAAKLRQDTFNDEDPSDDDEDTLPAPAECEAQLPKRLRLFFGTQYPILLKDLFDYGASTSEGQGLDAFMQTGLANLQKELEIYDLASRDLFNCATNKGIGLQISNMPPEMTFLSRGAAADIWNLLDAQRVRKVLRVPSERLIAADTNSDTRSPDNQWSQLLEVNTRGTTEYRHKATVWSSLKHNNLVNVFGLNGGWNLDVEYYENGCVRDYLKAHPGADKLAIIRDMLAGVSYLHNLSSPIVHGNLNAGKLFVSHDNTIKIGEFGLAALCCPVAADTPSISFSGLSRWMSPELLDIGIDDEVTPTRESDIWALGCTLFEHKHDVKVEREVIAGRPPGHCDDNLTATCFVFLWPIITACWESSPHLRPTSSMVAETFGQSCEWIQSTETASIWPLGPLWHLDYPGWLGNLGVFYLDRFDRLENLADLDAAIDNLDKAISWAPLGDEKLSHLLGNLGAALAGRFEHLGKMEDIDRAIGSLIRAVSLSSEGHPKRPFRLNNLGNSHYLRFNRLGERMDIDRAIEYQTLAVLGTPDGHPSKLEFLKRLSVLYQSLFTLSGALEHIDKAVDCGSHAVLLAPEDDKLKPILLDNLGNSYRQRYHRSCKIADLQNAITYQDKAMLLAPEGHQIRPWLLNNLGASLVIYFMAQGQSQDINKAIDCFSQVLDHTPSEGTNLPNCYSNLGCAYLSRYRRLGEHSDIDRAINYLNQAVYPAHRGRTDMTTKYYALGHAYEERFKSSAGTIADSDEAILNLGLAEIALPKDHNRRVLMEFLQGNIWASRYKQSNERSDLEHALRHFQKATTEPIGPARVRLAASIAWARLAAEENATASLVAYGEAMELLHVIVWLGPAAVHQFGDFAIAFSDIATEAAAVAIGAGMQELALEWLDQGRSITCNWMLQLPTPLNEITAVNPDLAQQLREVAIQIDQSTSLESIDYTQLPANPNSIEQEAQRHRQLAEQWDSLLGTARGFPGMSGFLRCKKVSELARAAESSAVVVFNVYCERCDALVIPKGTTSVLHIPLPSFSYQNMLDAHTELVRLLWHANVRSRGLKRSVSQGVDSNHELERLLFMLWRNLVHPVLDDLGYLSPQTAGQLPQVTWCTTGPLAFLPIHAAGHYPKTKAFDWVISSYAPTLSAMLVSREPQTGFRGILAVGQANTAGCTPLPGTVAELEAIRARAGGLSYKQLDGEYATVDAILAGVETHDWVHMACHGSQDIKDPTNSTFYVHGGTLELAKIARRLKRGGGLAFLSACQTAVGEVPKEAVQLGAGMVFAGYRTVIATMWSVTDDDVPLIVEKLYGVLLKDGMPDIRQVPSALHEAVGYLRNVVGEKEYLRWVPYVQFGI